MRSARMKEPRSQRLASMPQSVFAQLEGAKRQFLASGGKLINLGVGSPDRPPTPQIRRKLADEALRDDAYSYAIMGLEELHVAAADWYCRRFGVAVDPSTQVTDVMGSQDGWAHIFVALTNPGDVVLVPDPGYPICWSAPVLAGADIYPVPLLPENDFLPDLESIPADVLRRARALVLNYPANPTTATADEAFFARVVEWASRWGIWVLHDAAYSELTFDGYRAPSFLQAAGAADVGIEFNSLSKTFNMAGCRVGYALGNASIIAALREVKGHLDYGIFLPIQRAAIEALEQPIEVTRETAAVYERRRNVLVNGLREAGWNVESPRATMFCWAPLPPGAESAASFARQLLQETGVIVVPGSGFGPRGEGFVRIALVQPDAVLQEAVERIKVSGLL